MDITNTTEQVIDNQESTEKQAQSEETQNHSSEQEVSEKVTEESTEQAETESKGASNETESVDECAKLTAELAEMKDKHLRLQAEFDNYRRRTLKEKAELISTASETVLKNLLPVIDDLDRALETSQKATDVEGLRDGFELIVNKFNSFLKSNGVTEIEAKEQIFDADKHDAVTKFPAPSEDMKGKIIDVVKKGYVLNGKVIRYAQVVVGE